MRQVSTFIGMTTYLITVHAQYDPDNGSPLTLWSALGSAMLEFDYSMHLRDHGANPDDCNQRYVGLFTLDCHEAEDPRGPLLDAIAGTTPREWSISVFELDDLDPSVTNLAWRADSC